MIFPVLEPAITSSVLKCRQSVPFFGLIPHKPKTNVANQQIHYVYGISVNQ